MAREAARRTSPRSRNVSARIAGAAAVPREGHGGGEVEPAGRSRRERRLARGVDERGRTLARDPPSAHVVVEGELRHVFSRVARTPAEALTSSRCASRRPAPAARLPEALPPAGDAGAPAPVRFDTEPGRYRHWRLEADAGAAVARLVLDVSEGGGIRPGYPLKLNSYDLGVDIELADALQRVRFEHPSVRAIVLSSGKDRVFSSGANIYMLGASTHHFKVNFCKYTNETRLGLEEMSAESGIHSLAALAGTASGGGYELALACDEIVLVDDGSSAVSLPEAPLLGVLPGTGGLTRLVDKRKVRRDLADVFSTTAEGVRGKRAVEWGLVDEAPSKKDFDAAVARRAGAMAARGVRRPGKPIVLGPLEAARTATGAEYRYVSLGLDPGRRTASLTVRAPSGAEPETPEDLAAAGSRAWAIQVWRELDDALLDLRFNHPMVGVVAVRTAGEGSASSPSIACSRPTRTTASSTRRGSSRAARSSAWTTPRRASSRSSSPGARSRGRSSSSPSRPTASTCSTTPSSETRCACRR